MLRFIVSIFVILIGSTCGYGQIDYGPNDTDTARVRPPKPPKIKKELKEFIPTGARLGIDLYSLGRGIWEEEYSLMEFQVDVDFRHLLLALEYGTSKFEVSEEDFAYTNEGSYFKIGPEINFLYEPESFDAVFLGFRYVTSNLDDRLIFNTEDAYGTTQITSSNQKATAQWAEITTGTKIKVWKGLYMGFTLRYKFLKSVKFDDLEPHYLPGYGESTLDDNDQFGFSYYLMWRFGFRKKSVIPIEE